MKTHVLFSKAKLLYWRYLLNLRPATYTKDEKRLKQNVVKYVSKRYYGWFLASCYRVMIKGQICIKK